MGQLQMAECNFRKRVTGNNIISVIKINALFKDDVSLYIPLILLPRVKGILLYFVAYIGDFYSYNLY